MNAPPLPEALLRARYRDQPAAAPEAWSAVLDCLLAHRSVRAFLPDALPAGTLELLVAAAQSASTSSNLQSWSVVAVRDPERKARLSLLANDQAHMRQCPLLLVWLADLARLEAIGAEHGQSLDCLPYLETMLVGVIDAAIAAQNAVTAAESLGLGAVYVGAIRNHPAEVAAELGLPPRVFPICGMSIGRPDPSRPAAVKPRLAQSVVLHHERYSLEQQREGIARYDAVFREFQQEQGQKPSGWIANVLGRLGSVARLGGREQLREILEKLGFGLR